MFSRQLLRQSARFSSLSSVSAMSVAMRPRFFSQSQQLGSSLDTFEVLSAIFNAGSGGAVQSSVLKDKKKLTEVFQAMDQGNAGLLSRGDFQRSTKLCTMLLTENEIDRIFDEIDTNKSDTIELDEFVAAVGKVAEAGAVDLSNCEPGAKQVIQMWQKHMDGNARAAQIFTSKLRKESSLDTLKNVELDRQVQMVYGMIGNTFNALSNQKKLKDVLLVEGARHSKKFNMDSTHYQAVRKALFATLPEVMGDAYTAPVAKEFEKQFGFIESTLVQGTQKK